MAASSIQIQTIIEEIERDWEAYYLAYKNAPQTNLDREPDDLAKEFFKEYIDKKPWYPVINNISYSTQRYLKEFRKFIKATIVAYNHSKSALKPILDKSPQEVHEILKKSVDTIIATCNRVVVEIFLLHLKNQPQFYIDVLNQILMPSQKESSNLVKYNPNILSKSINHFDNLYVFSDNINMYNVTRHILDDIKKYLSNISYKKEPFIFSRLIAIDTLQTVKRRIDTLEENAMEKIQTVKILQSLNNAIKPTLEENQLNIHINLPVPIERLDENSFGENSNASRYLPHHRLKSLHEMSEDELNNLFNDIKQDNVEILRNYKNDYILTGRFIAQFDTMTTLLHQAAKEGALNCVKFLIEEMNMNCNTHINGIYGGPTPLHYAAKEGKITVVNYLIERGAHINDSENRLRHTPLHYAISDRSTVCTMIWDNQHYEAANILIDKGAPLEDSQPSDNIAPVIINEDQVFKLLLTALKQEGIDHVKVITALVNKFPSVLNRSFDHTRYTLLHTLLESADTLGIETAEKILKVFLEKNVDITLKNARRETAITMARNLNHQTMLAMLLSYAESRNSSSNSSSQETQESRPRYSAIAARSSSLFNSPATSSSRNTGTEIVFDPTSGQLVPGDADRDGVLRFNSEGNLKNPRRR